MRQRAGRFPAAVLGAVVALCVVTTARATQWGGSFRSGVDAVTMDVTVTDAQRRYITDLVQADFTVFEDGRPQQITAFESSRVPLAVSLLLDTSASMQRKLALAQEAATEFVRALRADDVASVVDFDNDVEIVQAFTGDREALTDAIRRTSAGGATALHNAVYIALRELERRGKVDGHLRRRAIVLLSDGEDTISPLRFDEVLDAAVRSGIGIYAIGLGLEGTGKRSEPWERAALFNLRQLTQQTGGRAFFPAQAAELTDVYRSVLDELSSQYTLAYESSNTRRDGQYRRIAIRVARYSAVARCRPGYYAPAR